MGIHDGDDIAQEVLFIALDVIQKYDPARGPIINFLSRSIPNRILNFIRNSSKFGNARLQTISIENVEEEQICVGDGRTTYDEFWQILDEQLAPEFRLDYLKMKQGIKLGKKRSEPLIAELKRIVEDYYA